MQTSKKYNTKKQSRREQELKQAEEELEEGL